MMKQFQTAFMDKWTKFYTFLFILISIGTFLFLLYKKAPVIASVVLSIILLSSFMISYLLIPKISANNSEITVKNSFVNIKIPVSEINHVEKIDKLGFNIRTLGVGGVLGHFGYFNGNDVWYVTNSYKKVKITMKSGQIYMLSPENPKEFIQYITNLKSNI